MINYLKFSSELKKLSNQKEQIQEAYSADIKKARQGKKSRDEIEGIITGEMFEVGMVQEEIDILTTNYLRVKASRLLVPIPEYNDKKMWTECNKISRQKVLTTLGISTLKSAVRKEHRERFELPSMIATLLIGIIGAATGLFAVLKN